MSTVITIVILTISTIIYGQSTEVPIIKNSAISIEEFIPRNWRILQKVTGDLNKDNLDDIAIVLQEKDKSKITKSINKFIQLRRNSA